jgi:protein-disulfide isomerase/uncharacterized membrane protein
MAATKKKRNAAAPASTQDAQDLPSQSDDQRMLWVVGLLLLVVAAAASGVMALKGMGVLGESLPGCGPASACDAITRGPFGSIPGLGWPVSFVGLAYFCGMLVAWTTCLTTVPLALRWLVRLSVLLSGMFLVVMAIEGAMCPYCLTTHLSNIAFWGILEGLAVRSVAGTSATCCKSDCCRVMVAWAVTFALVNVLLGLGDAHHASIMEPVHAEERALNEQALLATASTAGTGAAAASTFTGRHLLGPEDAPIKIVIFTDYQCPDCKKFERQISLIMDRRNDVSLSVKHFPFNTDCNDYMPRTKHAMACVAARAAETAGILGGEDAFWTWHAWLFDNEGNFQPGKARQELPTLVEEMGFDRRTFQSMMFSDEVTDMIREDTDEGSALGLYFTPMMFINGVQYKWSIPGQPGLSTTVDRLAAAIEQGQDGTADRAPDTRAQKYVADWRDAGVKLVRQPSRTFVVNIDGNGAPVDAVVFGDYTSDNMVSLFRHIKASGVPLRVDMRLYPLETFCNPNVSVDSPGACMAARAVLAAGLTGGVQGYGALHDWALANQPQLPDMDEAAWAAIAQSHGLEVAEFLDALTGPQTEQLVSEGIAEGKRLRIRSMPTIFVNGKPVPRPFLEGEPIMDRILKEAQQAQKDGPTSR